MFIPITLIFAIYFLVSIRPAYIKKGKVEKFFRISLIIVVIGIAAMIFAQTHDSDGGSDDKKVKNALLEFSLILVLTGAGGAIMTYNKKNALQNNQLKNSATSLHEEANTHHYCKSCGKEIEDNNTQFCGNCGAKF